MFKSNYINQNYLPFGKREKVFFCENHEKLWVEEKKKTWTDIKITFSSSYDFEWLARRRETFLVCRISKKMLVWRKDKKEKLQKCVYNLSTGNLLKERKLSMETFIRGMKKRITLGTRGFVLASSFSFNLGFVVVQRCITTTNDKVKACKIPRNFPRFWLQRKSFVRQILWEFFTKLFFSDCDHCRALRLTKALRKLRYIFKNLVCLIAISQHCHFL